MRFFSKNKIMEREKPQLLASLHIYDSLELYTTCRAHLYNAFMKQPYEAVIAASIFNHEGVKWGE